MGKLRMRILAGGVVAVFAGATAFAVTDSAGASPAQTAALTKSAAQDGTALSIRAAQSTIAAGQRDTITGTLTAGGKPAAGKVVELYAYSSRLHKWRPVRIKRTSSSGAVTFTARPGAGKSAKTRQYELVFHGDAALAQATSSAVTVTVTGSVTKRATVLSATATPAIVKAGQAVTITGALTADGKPLAHRLVALYRYDSAARKWARVAVRLTDAKGQVSFTRKPPASAGFALRFHGGPALTAGHSARVAITVTG
jgi:5-hydroxyisourate hydrolase-like protein (transthyretin family)